MQCFKKKKDLKKKERKKHTAKIFPVVKTVLSMQGAWVPFLVRELNPYAVGMQKQKQYVA